MNNMKVEFGYLPQLGGGKVFVSWYPPHVDHMFAGTVMVGGSGIAENVETKEDAVRVATQYIFQRWQSKIEDHLEAMFFLNSQTERIERHGLLAVLGPEVSP